MTTSRTFTDQDRRDFEWSCRRIDTDRAAEKAEEQLTGPRNCRIGRELRHIKEHHLYEIDGYVDLDGGDSAFYVWAQQQRGIHDRQADRYIDASFLSHMSRGRGPVKELSAVRHSPDWLWPALVEAVEDEKNISSAQVVLGRRHGMRRRDEGASEEVAAREARAVALGHLKPAVPRDPQQEGRKALNRVFSSLDVLRKLAAQNGEDLGRGFLEQVKGCASAVIKEVDSYLVLDTVPVMVSPPGPRGPAVSPGPQGPETSPGPQGPETGQPARAEAPDKDRRRQARESPKPGAQAGAAAPGADAAAGAATAGTPHTGDADHGAQDEDLEDGDQGAQDRAADHDGEGEIEWVEGWDQPIADATRAALNEAEQAEVAELFFNVFRGASVPDLFERADGLWDRCHMEQAGVSGDDFDDWVDGVCSEDPVTRGLFALEFLKKLRPPEYGWWIHRLAACEVAPALHRAAEEAAAGVPLVDLPRQGEGEEAELAWEMDVFMAALEEKFEECLDAAYIVQRMLFDEAYDAWEWTIEVLGPPPQLGTVVPPGAMIFSR